MKNYKELSTFPSFEERLEYLKLPKAVGEETFGFDRFANQAFYSSKEWRDIRNYVITRDKALDLGLEDHEILGTIVVHHIVPITLDDLLERKAIVLDPNFLITVSGETHKIIHYGGSAPPQYSERRPFDTCPWRGGLHE